MNALAGPLFVIVGVLVAAGSAKILRPSPTASALQVLRVPRPVMASRLLGLVELVVAAIAVTTGHPLAWAAIGALYAAFTIFVLWALGSSKPIGSCGCFGQEDTPPTIGHAVFNAVAAALAGLAVVDPVGIGDFDGSGLQLVLFAGLVVAGSTLAVLALTALPRLLTLVHGTPTVDTPTFALATDPSTAKSHPEEPGK